MFCSDLIWRNHQGKLSLVPGHGRQCSSCSVCSIKATALQQSNIYISIICHPTGDSVHRFSPHILLCTDTVEHSHTHSLQKYSLQKHDACHLALPLQAVTMDGAGNCRQHIPIANKRSSHPSAFSILLSLACGLIHRPNSFFMLRWCLLVPCCLLLQIWSGSSDGSVAVTDLDSSGKLDTSLARSLKTPSGKGTLPISPASLHTPTPHSSDTYAVQVPSDFVDLVSNFKLAPAQNVLKPYF